MAKNKEKLYKKLSVVLAIALFAVLVYFFYPSPFYLTVATVTIPQLSTNGFVQANVTADLTDQNTGNVTLSANCYDLIGGVEASQAVSIIDALDNQFGPRPNAHDLARDVFTALKINVLMVKVTEVKDSAFYAKIVLRQGNTVLNYDIRPSDGIAIALRMNAPIYVNETLLMTEGTKVC
jgi:bifunctional DNase/RNase